MKLSKALFGSLFLLASLIFISPVLAGGGPVYIDIGSTLSSWNYSGPRQIVAKVHLHPDIPCVGTKVTFKYEEQKDGDSVTTGSSGDTITITQEGRRWLNGKSVYDCGAYAKYTSKNRELKHAIIVVSTLKGKAHERKVALNFQNNDPIISAGDSLPWDDEVSSSDTSTPSGDIYMKVGNQRYVGGPKRFVYLSWNKVEGAIKYNVYVRLSDMKEFGVPVAGIGGLSTEIGINAFLDYYVRVDACSGPGACISSKEVFIKAMSKEVAASIPVATPSGPKPYALEAKEQTVIKTEASDSVEIEQLNKKVKNLQNQLEESKQKQSVLETRLNQVLSWIKSVFPFLNK